MSIERQPRIPQEEPAQNLPAQAKDSVGELDKILNQENQPSETEEKALKAETRQFSRITDPEMRQQLAQEIRERRSLRQKLLEVDQNTVKKTTDVENLTKSAEKLRERTNELSSSLWGRLTSWNTRARLEKLIDRKMTLKEVHERELSDWQTVKADTALALEGRREVDDDKALLDSYYGETKKRLEDVKMATSVEHVMNEHQALFIHGMSEYIPEYNSILMADGRITLETKLRILIGLQPTISTSTMKEGEDGSRIMHQVGVILNGGMVESAHSFDSGTVPTSVKGRSRRFDQLSEQQAFLREPKSILAEAINQKSGPWNELVVAEPEPAALYFTYELYEEGGYRKKIQGLQELAQKYNFPLYCLKNGKAYEFTLELRHMWDKYSGPYKFYQLDTTREVNISEIIQAKRIVEEKEKKDLLDDVLRELPFNPEKIGITEAKQIENSERGREIACVLYALQHPEFGENANYELWDGEGDSMIPPASPIRVVGDFHALAGRNQYFYNEGKLFERYSPSIWDHRPQERNIYTRGTEYAALFYKKIHSPDEFFAVIQQRFQEIQEREQKYQAQGKTNPLEETRIRELKEESALILYGFADEAEDNSDSENARQAQALAATIAIFTPEQYQDLRARRIKDGTFVLYPEDIGVKPKN